MAARKRLISASIEGDAFSSFVAASGGRGAAVAIPGIDGETATTASASHPRATTTLRIRSMHRIIVSHPPNPMSAKQRRPAGQTMVVIFPAGHVAVLNRLRAQLRA